MDSEYLLEGFSEVMSNVISSLEMMNENILVELKKIGNELQFICEELEAKNHKPPSEDIMAGVI